jgi:nitric oxide reductase activation protein
MARINANSGNLDGYALAKTAQFINEWKNNDYEFESHLWLISDGKPCSVGYGGMEAADHMKRVVRASLAKNIRIFGIGIDNAFDKKEGDSMYGAGNYIVLPDVISSMTVLGKKLTTVLNSGIKIVID